MRQLFGAVDIERVKKYLKHAVGPPAINSHYWAVGELTYLEPIPPTATNGRIRGSESQLLAPIEIDCDLAQILWSRAATPLLSASTSSALGLAHAPRHLNRRNPSTTSTWLQPQPYATRGKPPKVAVTA